MRADRLLRIMLRLQMRQKVTTHELACELGVSRRTILRDIDALSVAGIPIYTQSGQGGGIALDEGYRISLTGLKEAEVRALYLSGNAKLLSDIGLHDASNEALLKFFASLPSLQQQLVQHVRQRIYIDSNWWIEDEPPPFLSDLLYAIDHSLQVRAAYRPTNDDVAERLLKPYGLVAKGGIWYLIAKREDRFRTYRVSRFHRVTLLEARFQRDDAFDLASFWHTHVGEFFESLLAYRFTLRIHCRQEDFIRKHSTGHYEIIDRVEGQSWMTVHFKAESVQSAIMLVFRLGLDASVIEPQELLDAVYAQSRLLLGICQR